MMGRWAGKDVRGERGEDGTGGWGGLSALGDGFGDDLGRWPRLGWGRTFGPMVRGEWGDGWVEAGIVGYGSGERWVWKRMGVGYVGGALGV